MRIGLIGIGLGLSMSLTACGQNAAQDTQPTADEAAVTEPGAPADESAITLGNGEDNAIQTDGITRSGAIFTVPEVTIAKQGWAVMHPFRDGAPVRNEYVGATLVKAGTTENVTIDVETVPSEGDMFILMLHNDENQDGVFDFGNGEDDVPDAPTFEGEMLIAHPIPAPADDAKG